MIYEKMYLYLPVPKLTLRMVVRKGKPSSMWLILSRNCFISPLLVM